MTYNRRLPWYVAARHIILISLALWMLIFFGIYKARADDAAIPVMLDKTERAALLNMCEAATWAARLQFDGACVALRKRFDEAEKSAAPPPQPPTKRGR